MTTLGASSAPGILTTAERKLSNGGDRQRQRLRLAQPYWSMHSALAIAARRWTPTSEFVRLRKRQLLRDRQLCHGALRWRAGTV